MLEGKAHDARTANGVASWDILCDVAPCELDTTNGVAISPEEKEFVRRKNVEANLKAIEKYYDRAFVRGEPLRDGQHYVGRGARELFASFTEYSDFATNLMRLVPNPHDALKTIRDNRDYLIDEFTKIYKKNHEQKQREPQNPYELARAANYELTGPFETTNEFLKYESDFRPGELICTYLDPDTRLKAYHIFWLRSHDVGEVPPADKLTQENLTESWKEHLMRNGRYDPGTGVYNLDGLSPAREDPYGTSSMSVQVSRTGLHVSIKNRYNHRVTNPDATFGNDLDNVADGLRMAVYTKIGRVDLMDVSSAKIKDDYVLDNDGGIHKYYYEKNNIYLGHYGTIKDGVVTKIDKKQYDMISPEMYLSKAKNGKVIFADGVERKTNFNYHKEKRTGELSMLDDEGRPIGTYSYRYDEHNRAVNLRLNVAKGARMGDICNNPALTGLTVSEGAMVGGVYYNPALTEFAAAEGAMVGSVCSNPALTEFAAAEGAEVGDVFDNPVLTKLTIAERAMIGNIYNNLSLMELAVAKGARIGDIFSNPALTEIWLAEGARMRSISGNHSLTTVTLAESARMRSISGNPSLTAITLAEGAEVGDIFRNLAVGDVRRNSVSTIITLAEGAIVGNIFRNPALKELTAAEWARIGAIYHNLKLAAITLAEGVETADIYENSPNLVIESYNIKL